MTVHENSFFGKILARGRKNSIGKLFLDKRFVHYTWASIFVSVLNIFLIWLFVDIFHIHTIISTTIVVGMTFVIRYVFFDYLRVL
ncbi:MAG TPA: GtrA family protein [Candidatus Nanoarchaeia archaeon]|nr:GtrA family protein [Candidatus Nanoarchaeia archaeon]